MLTQDQKQKFIACLEQKMKVKLVFQWEDFLYFQYIGCSETGGAAAYIAGAKATARIPREKLQVLVEYPTVPDKRKFAFHGNRLAADMLSKLYGGFVSQGLYWILHNERNISGQKPFGFAKNIYSVDCIEPRVICEQITYMLKGIDCSSTVLTL